MSCMADRMDTPMLREETMVMEEDVAPAPEPQPRAADPEQVGDALPLYLQEIGRVRLLTGPQEVQLAQAIEAGGLAGERLRDREGITPEEVEELEQQVLAGEEARRKLIEANLRLVVSVARRYM